MTENLPAPNTGNWLTEWLANGKIPGAAKAIAHLIGSAANAGSAWIDIAKVKGEQVQQGIRDETEARKVLIKAVGKAAAERGSQDAVLVERAVDRLAGKAFRAQANLESVAKKTIEIIDEGEAIDPATPAPDEDWLNFLSAHAENASSERLQATWARVMAGEIRKPGTFSFRTLQFIATLDKKTAEIFQEVANEISDELYIPLPARFNFTKFFSKMSHLRECGILHQDMAYQVELKKDVGFGLSLGKKYKVGVLPKVDEKNWQFSHAALTQVGEELYRILYIDPPAGSATALADAMYKTSKFSKCEVFLLDNEGAEKEQVYKVSD